jgi:hypothetical protein
MTLMATQDGFDVSAGDFVHVVFHAKGLGGVPKCYLLTRPGKPGKVRQDMATSTLHKYFWSRENAERYVSDHAADHNPATCPTN